MMIDCTVVLIGRTGAGKSSCANALAQGGKNAFAESNLSVSKTKFVEPQVVRVPYPKGRRELCLKIVDTIGIGDTDLSLEGVLQRLAQACHECREGINAIYFVTGDRFTQAEADAFDILWQVLFGAKILEFTTIVRTKFVEYQDSAEVQKDQEELRKQQGPASRILKQITKPYIYVDIPPKKYDPEGKDRKASGEILLDYLVLKCKKVFKPPVLEKVKQRISGHVEKEKKLAEQLEKMTKTLEHLQAKLDSSHEQLQLQKDMAAIQRERSEQQQKYVGEMNKLLAERALEEKGVGERILGGVGAGIDGMGRWVKQKCIVM